MRYGLISVAAFSATLLSMTAGAETLLATYDKLGIQAYAVDQGENWCGNEINLQYRATTASFPSHEGMDEFTRKLGAVLSRECGSASELSVTGIDAEGNIAYRGEASLASGWALVKLTSGQQMQAASKDSASPATGSTGTTERKDLLAALNALKNPTKETSTKDSERISIEEPQESPAPLTGETNAPRPAPSEEFVSGQIDQAPKSPEVRHTTTKQDLLSALETLSDGKKLPEKSRATTEPTAPAETASSATTSATMSTKPKLVFVENGNLAHVELPSATNQNCKFYHTTFQPSSFRNITFSSNGVDCSSGVVNGSGIVEIPNGAGGSHRLIGSFSQGFFTGNKLWSEPFLYRTRDLEEVPEILYKLAEDPANSRVYLGRLTPKNGRWAACLQRPVIDVIVQNESAVQNAQNLSAIVTKSGQLAASQCPDTKEALIRISSSAEKPTLLHRSLHEETYNHIFLHSPIRTNASGWEIYNNKNAGYKDFMTARIDEHREQVAVALVKCETAFESGKHDAVLNMCEADILDENATAKAVIETSVKREEERVVALETCLDVRNQKADPLSDLARAKEACDIKLLAGMEQARKVLNEAQENAAAFTGIIKKRQQRLVQIKDGHQRAYDNWAAYKEEHDRLKDTALRDRLDLVVSRMFGKREFDNLQASVATSLLRRRAVEHGTYFVKIDDVRANPNTGLKEGAIEWPYPAKVIIEDEIELSDGFFILQGDVFALEGEKSGYRTIGELRPEKYFSCEEDYCNELKDTTKLINMLYQLQNWSPNGPPDQPDYQEILDKEFPELASLPIQTKE